jgi:CYTH domain-containing protein
VQLLVTEREFRDYHERAAARLRAVAATATTAAVRARIIEQAEQHERLARQLAELNVNAEG